MQMVQVPLAYLVVGEGRDLGAVQQLWCRFESLSGV